ncbi:hypothetical protein ACFL0A_01835 [Patescibacteria group bacterium]
MIGLFDKNKQIPRREFREALRKASYSVPGGGTLGRRERVELEKRLFPQKRFAGYISKSEANKVLRELAREESRATNFKDKIAFGRYRRLLKKETGL